MSQGTKFDARQTESRDALNRLANNAEKPRLDSLIRSIEAELTPPLELKASDPADLTLNIGPIFVLNEETDMSKTIPPISNELPNFTGGTVVFPSTSGNDAVPSIGSNLTINISSGNFLKVLISLDKDGEIVLAAGNEGATEDAATVPASLSNVFAIGYVVLHNDSGTIQPILNSNIYQFAGGGGGGEGALTTDIVASDKTIEAGTTLNQSFLNVPAGVTVTIDGQHVGAELTVEGDYIVNGESIILGTAQIDQIGLASPVKTGLVSHEAPLQSFAGPKEFIDEVRFTGGFDTTGDAGMATSTAAGLVGTGTQTFAGTKTFNDPILTADPRSPPGFRTLPGKAFFANTTTTTVTIDTGISATQQGIFSLVWRYASNIGNGGGTAMVGRLNALASLGIYGTLTANSGTVAAADVSGQIRLTLTAPAGSNNTHFHVVLSGEYDL